MKPSYAQRSAQLSQDLDDLAQMTGAAPAGAALPYRPREPSRAPARPGKTQRSIATPVLTADPRQQMNQQQLNPYARSPIAPLGQTRPVASTSVSVATSARKMTASTPEPQPPHPAGASARICDAGTISVMGLPGGIGAQSLEWQTYPLKIVDGTLRMFLPSGEFNRYADAAFQTWLSQPHAQQTAWNVPAPGAPFPNYNFRSFNRTATACGDAPSVPVKKVPSFFHNRPQQPPPPVPVPGSPPAPESPPPPREPSEGPCGTMQIPVSFPSASAKSNAVSDARRAGLGSACIAALQAVPVAAPPAPEAPPRSPAMVACGAEPPASFESIDARNRWAAPVNTPECNAIAAAVPIVPRVSGPCGTPARFASIAERARWIASQTNPTAECIQQAMAVPIVPPGDDAETRRICEALIAAIPPEVARDERRLREWCKQNPRCCSEEPSPIPIVRAQDLALARSERTGEESFPVLPVAGAVVGTVVGVTAAALIASWAAGS